MSDSNYVASRHLTCKLPPGVVGGRSDSSRTRQTRRTSFVAQAPNIPTQHAGMRPPDTPCRGAAAAQHDTVTGAPSASPSSPHASQMREDLPLARLGSPRPSRESHPPIRATRAPSARRRTQEAARTPPSAGRHILALWPCGGARVPGGGRRTRRAQPHPSAGSRA